jgi:myo-inositol-1(or 4)-monophosphatase
MDRDLTGLGIFLEELVCSAGEVALAHFHPSGTEHTYKEGAAEQALSIADQLANDKLVQGVLARFPNDGIVSEEEARALNPDAEYRWIFDPIDGTRNFVNGIPFWAVFGCLVRGGDLIASVVHCPCLGLVYTALRGQGARRNGTVIRCNDKQTLKGALGAYIIGGHGVFVEQYREAASKLLVETSWIQNLGSLATVGYIASGGMDFLFANCCNDHDYAAPALIAAEAGATVTDSHGRPWRLGRRDIVIASPGLHPHILQLIHSEGERD